MKNILIVTNDNDLATEWQRRLEEYDVSASYAYDVRFAIEESDRYDLVAVETCVGSKTFNTGALLKSLPPHCNGPIVVVDKSPGIRQIMLNYFRCTHEAHPDDLVNTIIMLLGLRSFS